MKTIKNIIIIAYYRGIVPVKSEIGNKKYIGYDHLFEKVRSKDFMYSRARAKSIPCKIAIDSDVIMTANFKSSIITDIKYLRYYNGYE